MRKISACILAVCACIVVSAQTPASDPAVLYNGRVLTQGGAVSFDWSGVYAKIRFHGTSLSVRCSDSKGHSYLNVWVDSAMGVEAGKVVRVGKETSEIILAKGLKKGAHEVIIQKRTEGEQGCVTLNEFMTDGKILHADGARQRRIECIGDSYTCGYGTENSRRDDPFKAETENCNKAYGFILGRLFDADVTLFSHSGRGVARNYGDFGKFEDTMTHKYSKTFDEASDALWEGTCTKPDIVIIYLGTNDFSVGKQPSLNAFCNNYKTLLGKVRANYGDTVPVLCVASKADVLMGQYVKTAVERCGLANVHWMAIQTDAHNNDSELGASWHPNYEGQRKVASLMAPYVSTLTGWAYPHKIVE